MTMAIWRGLRWAIAPVLFIITIPAQGRCAPTPEKYLNLEFGDVRFAVEENCRFKFKRNEQFFLAGISQTLKQACKLPRNGEAQALLGAFTEAATASLELRKQPGTLHESSDAMAFAAGTSMMENIRCDGPEAALLARGLVLYLQRTSGVSRFVTGCAEFYAGRYDEKQCHCVRDAIRNAIPDVDQRFFDREVIKESIHDSPSVAVTLMFSCRVTSY